MEDKLDRDRTLLYEGDRLGAPRDPDTTTHQHLRNYFELGPLDDLGDKMQAFISGFARDFTLEHVDEFIGMIDAMAGKGTYKERRDRQRKFLNEVRKEYPDIEMAGRVTSVIAQILMTKGGSVPLRALGTLMAKFGVKNVVNKLPFIARYIKNNPTVGTLLENIAETSINIMGESKEAKDIAKDMVTKPDLAATTALTYAPKALKAAASIPKGIKNIPEGFKNALRKGRIPEKWAAIKGLSPDAIKYIRDKYDLFLPKGLQTTKEERVDVILDFVEDITVDMEALRKKAYNSLSNNIPQAHLSKKKLSGVINESILDIFKNPAYKEGVEAFGINPTEMKQLKKMLNLKWDKGQGWAFLSSEDILEAPFLKLYKNDPMLNELLKVREVIAHGPDFFTETALKKNIIEDRLDDLADWRTGTLKDGYGNLKDVKIKQAARAVARKARRRVDNILKSKNKEYEKYIKPYNEANKYIRGDEGEKIPGLLDLMGINITKTGEALADDRDKIDNIMMEVFFHQAPKKGGKRQGKTRVQEVFTNAIVQANRIQKAVRGKKSDFIKNFSDYKKGLVQDKFASPESANEFVEMLGKEFSLKVKDGDGAGLLAAIDDLLLTGLALPANVSKKIGIPLMGHFLVKQTGRFDRGAAIAEAEKFIKEYKKSPEVALKKIGLGKKFLENLEQKRNLVAPTVRGVQDLDQIEEAETFDLRPKELMGDPPLVEKQNDEQPTFKDLPKFYGVPDSEPKRVPAHDGKLESIEVEEVEEEIVPNPEEKDRLDREEKVQSFLDQQLGGSVGKRKYA